MKTDSYKPEWVAQAIKEDRYPFFIQIPVIKDYHKQGITTILGLGTAVERSRTGHKMMQPFVDKLKQVSVGKHLFVNHNPDKIAGKITGIREGRPDEILPIAELLTPHDNPLVDAPRATVEHWIQNRVPIGLSFGGTADKIKTVKDKEGRVTYEIHDGELMEWSVTPINAVKRSDGSVKDCPGGVCQQIATQIEEGVQLPNLPNKDVEDMMDDKITADTTDKVVEEVNQEIKETKEIEEDSEDNIMTDEILQAINELKHENNELRESIKILVEDKKEKERIAQEAETEKEIQARVDKALEEQSKTFKEATVELINEEFGRILKDRTGVKQASEEGDEEVREAVAPKKDKIEYDLKDPSRYPAVIGGQIVQGKTPSQLLGA